MPDFKYIPLCLFSFLFSGIYNVPSQEYPTIQSGINAADHGDTVLVDQGVYYENLQITKSITLTSYAIFDDLTDWNAFNEIFWQWEVINENINNTIIDGGQSTDGFGSTILISSDFSCQSNEQSWQCNNAQGCIWDYDDGACFSVEDCINPEIIGFTIQNGIGTSVKRNPDTAFEETQILGGGILFDVSNPIIEYNQFINNGDGENCSNRDDCTDEGGALYSTTSHEDWDFNNRSSSVSRCDISEFSLSNNLLSLIHI